MNSWQAWLQNRPLHLDHTRNRQMGFQESSENIYLNCSRLLRPHAIDAIYAYACTHCRPIFQLHSDQNYLSLRQLERQSPVTTFLGRGVSVPLTHSRVFYAFPYIFAVGPKRA